MSLKPYASLPCGMQNKACRRYYDLLDRKRGQLVVKRASDLLLSAALLVLTAPLLAILAAAVTLDSPGGPIFCQRRRTRYNQPFTMYKFRT
ncbi:MAG: sugar transferase, partial [Oscillospiraceae bacterium]